jgi:hypothetical protein
MTRQTTSQLWYEQQDRNIRIGFTKEFLEQLDQCWHILPANLSRIKANAPLMAIETNDALISVLSPVSGSFVTFSHKAQNFPNKLTEDDVVMELIEGKTSQIPRPVDEMAAAPAIAPPRARRPGGGVFNADWAVPQAVVPGLIRAEAEANRIRAFQEEARRQIGRRQVVQGDDVLQNNQAMDWNE